MENKERDSRSDKNEKEQQTPGVIKVEHFLKTESNNSSGNKSGKEDQNPSKLNPETEIFTNPETDKRIHNQNLKNKNQPL